MKILLLALVTVIAITPIVAKTSEHQPLTQENFEPTKEEFKQLSWLFSMDSYLRAFKGKYNMLPGDAEKAKRFFVGKNVIDGDGNGKIEGEESYHFWSHLRAAGIHSPKWFIEGERSDDELLTIGVDVPITIFPNVSLIAEYTELYGHTGNAFFWGRLSANKGLKNAAFSSYNAFLIDKYFDDGKPTTGSIMAKDGSGVSGCIIEGEYDQTNKEVKCNIIRWTSIK